MADNRRMSDNPRAPADHDLTGTGSPRSADDGQPQPGVLAGTDAASDPSLEAGRETTAQPAQADDLNINRSGSGGSGGPATPDDSVEGSTGQSMSELLAGDDDTEPQA